MHKALEEIKKNMSSDSFVKCIFSNPRDKSNHLKSIVIIPLKNKDDLKVEYRLEKHNDIKTMKLSSFVDVDLEQILKDFKQILLKCDGSDTQILLNQKLKSKFITTQKTNVSKSQNHNKKKNYIIPDGKPCQFLFEIGVMDIRGKVKSNYYKKFRQINRFLELVDDLFRDDEIASFHAVDFGCGKSYLTFALYYYFKNIKNINPKITGIDLKQEVIDHCNDVARKVNFDGLHFAHGFIHNFNTDESVDFVVTLHACNTATDDAILFSLRNKAKKMMFVPCCQHELNKQIKNSESAIMLKHGIFKDRMCSLITDTMRSQLLEVCGFKVQSMEFIDLEHTAKNIMLRCVQVNRSEKQTGQILEKYKVFKKQWGIDPYLEKKLLEEKFICSN